LFGTFRRLAGLLATSPATTGTDDPGVELISDSELPPPEGESDKEIAPVGPGLNAGVRTRVASEVPNLSWEYIGDTFSGIIGRKEDASSEA